MTRIIQSRDTQPGVPVGDDQKARESAIRQIERKRRFWMRTGMFSIGMVVLVFIWALTEYYNAGGWPVHGFGQSSGIHGVWNLWIVYPFVAWLLLTAGPAWAVYASGTSRGHRSWRTWSSRPLQSSFLSRLLRWPYAFPGVSRVM